MNKISLILLFSILVYPSTCMRKYKCADKLKINTCYLRMETGTYVKGCAKNEKCTNVDLNDGSYLNQCVKVKEFRENGDSCVVNEECQSSYCANGKCAYIPDGKKCEYSRSCNKNQDAKGMMNKISKHVRLYLIKMSNAILPMIVLLDYYVIRQ